MVFWTSVFWTLIFWTTDFFFATEGLYCTHGFTVIHVYHTGCYWFTHYNTHYIFNVVGCTNYYCIEFAMQYGLNVIWWPRRFAPTLAQTGTYSNLSNIFCLIRKIVRWQGIIQAMSIISYIKWKVFCLCRGSNPGPQITKPHNSTILPVRYHWGMTPSPPHIL